MSHDVNNYERHKSAYRAGHVLPQEAPHVSFRIDLDDFRAGPLQKGLLADLKQAVDRIERQVRATGSPLGPTIAVYELVDNMLYITAAVIEARKPPKNIEPIPELPSAPPDAMPESHPTGPSGDLAETQQDSAPQKADPPKQSGIESAAQPSSASHELEGDAAVQPREPEVEATDTDQTSAQLQDEFEDAGWRTHEILTLAGKGKLPYFENLSEEINKGPAPEKIKDWLVNIKPEWKPWETRRGLLSWEGLRALDGYLPSKNTAVVDAIVHTTDPITRTAALEVKRLYTHEHTGVLAKFGTPRKPYLPVTVATYELADLLAFYRGIGLKARLSLAVQFSLVQTKKPRLIVTLTCPVETSSSIIKAAVAKKLALVLQRPAQLGLWDAPDAE